MIVNPAYAYMGKAPAKTVYGFVGTNTGYDKADWVIVDNAYAADIKNVDGIYKIVITGWSSTGSKHIEINQVQEYKRKFLKFDYDKSKSSSIHVKSTDAAGNNTEIFSDTSASEVKNKEVSIEVPSNSVKISISNSTEYTNRTVKLNNIRYEN